MATFHSLSPPLGSHQNRNALDLFSVQLELALPQDHFLPAEGIQAQVWTNLIHQRNPEGPETWAELPMKLSQVIPGSSIAVFTARLLPTGRGDFGLTCRWKSHKDQQEWTWATKSGEEENLTITVRVPRSISTSWTLGPQSVLVYGADGPRQKGGRGVGGPGLYLGNHAAATRARISGYESVLSLVGDLLDFDEKIPESDKDVNKKAWLEQQTMKASIGGSLSRSNSLSGFGSSMSLANVLNQDEGKLSRRTSVGDFMVNYIPGVSSNSVVDIYSVINDPVDPPRLTRRNSVTDMMVQPPSQTSKRAMRISASSSSITSIGELDQEKEMKTPSKELSSTTKSTSKLNGNNPPKNETQTPSQGKKSPMTTTSAAAAAIPLPGTSGGTPPVSKKEKKAAAAAAAAASASAAAAAASASAASATPTSTTPGTALPPVSAINKATSGKVVPQTPTETVPSLAVSTAPTKVKEKTALTGADSQQSQPPTSAKVISGLYSQTWDTHSTLSSFSAHASSTNPPTSNGRPSQSDESGAKAKPAFQHKVISLAPGAHNRISEALLREAVDFLHKEISQGKKVLVHCRDGNGRSGSVALAYIAAQTQKQNQEKSQPKKSKGEIYNQSLQEIWNWKCDVYPHRGLRSTLETMEWTL